MNQIETGYKPEFALGALYQGQNAANAQSQNDQELIKRFLENQHALVNNPIAEEKSRLGLDPARYESLLSKFKMEDPNYIPAQLEGQIGQMQTQKAAGKFATDTLELKTKLANAVASGALPREKLMELLNELGLAEVMREEQPAPDTSIQEGFSMPNGGTTAGRNAFFPSAIGPIKTEAAMKASMGNDYAGETPLPGYFDQIDKAIAAAKNPNVLAALQAERKDMESKKGQPITSTPSPVFSNMAAPTQVADNSAYERAMKFAMDTPEYRQKMALAKQAQDAAAAKAAANAAAMQHIAELRSRAGQGKQPTTAEAAKTQMIMNDPNLDQYTKSLLLNEIINSKNVGKSAEGQQFGITMDGKKIVPGMQQTVPPVTGTLGGQSSTAQEEKTINGVAYVKVPGGWKKK